MIEEALKVFVVAVAIYIVTMVALAAIIHAFVI